MADSLWIAGSKLQRKNQPERSDRLAGFCYAFLSSILRSDSA
jgi:hypothetical protein